MVTALTHDAAAAGVAVAAVNPADTIMALPARAVRRRKDCTGLPRFGFVKASDSHSLQLSGLSCTCNMSLVQGTFTW